jgi:hypothetical protein
MLYYDIFPVSVFLQETGTAELLNSQGQAVEKLVTQESYRGFSLFAAHGVSAPWPTNHLAIR